MCNQTLNRGATVSHFGQKHSMVELYLPIEAWIPFLPSKKRSSKKRVPSANAKRRKTSELSDSDQSWEIENNVDLDNSWESKRYVPSSTAKRRKTSENYELSDSDQSCEIEKFNCYSYPKQPGSPQHHLTCRTVSTSWSRFERIGCQRYGLHKEVNFETAGYQFGSQAELLPVSVAEW